MRIRTDGDKAHRADIIDAAANRLGVNKTLAVLISCDVVGDVLDGVEEALENEELSPRVRNELAETISTRRIAIEASKPDVEIDLV